MSDALFATDTAVRVCEPSQLGQKFDSETDVVLVDAGSTDGVMEWLTRTRATSEYEFQVGVLTETPQTDTGDADAIIPWSLSADAVDELVEWLIARAQYCETLSEYYEVTWTLVDQQKADGTGTESIYLRAQRDRLEARLDEIADSLDTQALFDAVLE